MTGPQAPITGSTPEAPVRTTTPRCFSIVVFKGLVVCAFTMLPIRRKSFQAVGIQHRRDRFRHAPELLRRGKYAYLDCAPDDIFIHQPSYFRPFINGNMIVDCSDPTNAKEVSFWWVPGSRKGEEAEYRSGYGRSWFPPKLPAIRCPSPACTVPCMSPRSWKTGATADMARSGATGLSFSTFPTQPIRKVVGRFEPPPQYAGMGIAFHTIYCGVMDRGFVITNGEITNSDCNQIFLPNWVVDIRDEQHPVPVAQFPRPVPPPDAPYSDFCFKRGRFGTHNPPAPEGARQAAPRLYRPCVFRSVG